GQAEHVVVVDHQPAQEQLLDLLHGEWRGFRVRAALGDVRVQELQGRLFVAHVGQRILADVHGNGQEGDVVLPQVIARQVAGRVDDESDTHGAFFSWVPGPQATPNGGVLHPDPAGPGVA